MSRRAGCAVKGKSYARRRRPKPTCHQLWRPPSAIIAFRLRKRRVATAIDAESSPDGISSRTSKTSQTLARTVRGPGGAGCYRPFRGDSRVFTSPPSRIRTAGLKHVLSEFVLRQACPERRPSFDRLRMSGIEGLRTNESTGPAPPLPQHQTDTSAPRAASPVAQPVFAAGTLRRWRDPSGLRMD